MLFKKKAEKIQAPKKEAKAKPVKKEPVKKASAKKAVSAKKQAPVKSASVKKAPAKKAPAKKVDLKDATRVYHVAKREEDGMWAVKFAGGEKAIKLFKTQAEAIEYSKQMAENQGGKMLVHNSKGQNKGRIKSK